MEQWAETLEGLSKERTRYAGTNTSLQPMSTS